MTALSSDFMARLRRCREVALQLRVSPAQQRNRVLAEVARLLQTRQKEIIDANRLDNEALPDSFSPAFRDRLLLNSDRLKQAGESLRQVAELPDPCGEQIEKRTLANGLQLRRVRAPLGVILMIFESRPNVALEAFSLALKSGNVLILRGGKEGMRTTGAIYQIIHEALGICGMSADTVWGITDPDRKIIQSLLQQKNWIDVVVPRGGDQLIQFVVENSHIPIIKNDRGLCHIYIDRDADLKMAAEVVENAKTQRPGVCNAMETVLVHEAVGAAFIPALHQKLEKYPVQWFACEATRKYLAGKKHVEAATVESWDTEYLDLKMNCRVVDSLESAISHIEAHSSRHSEAIVTRSEPAARRFQMEVDSAAVYWNASTRFTDGFEFGLGGELGISTQKLHVRGPVGLKELTSARWVIDGTGQVRR